MAEAVGEPTVGERVAGFVAELRRRGLAVTTRQTLAFVDGLAATGGAHAREVALATLAVSPADAAALDHLLTVPSPASDPPDSASGMLARRDGSVGRTAQAADDGPPASGEFSAIEVLRARDLAGCTDEERAAIRRAIDRIELSGPPRRSRRWTGSPSRGRIDARATLRAAARAHGELIHLRRLMRRERPRRVVLLLDVSGSMEPYARTALQLAYTGANAAGRGVEAFALGTQLTRLTRQLRGRDPDAAFVAATRAASDWGGGTRLGANLAGLLDDPTTNGLVRGAVVVMLSDGLDRGDPEELAGQMARLARLAHRIVWVNPRRAGEGYEPLAEGMAAALPFVDDFVDGHSLGSFEALSDLAAGRSRRVRP